MGKRRGYEFSEDTKDRIYNQTRGRCEKCGSTKQLENHHIVAIWACKKLRIPAWIANSYINCSLLCHDCHEKLHNEESINEYKILAQGLFGSLEALF